MPQRRSGNESSWIRPPRAARPHSCVEGRLKEEWLLTFNNLQTCPIQQQLPPYLQKNDTPRSVSPSLVASSQSSLESLYSGLESKERVRIKTGPSTQRAKVCCLAPVRIGWLPLQRFMLREERPNNADQKDGTSCKVRAKTTGLIMIHKCCYKNFKRNMQISNVLFKWLHFPRSGISFIWIKAKHIWIYTLFHRNYYKRHKPVLAQIFCQEKKKILPFIVKIWS